MFASTLCLIAAALVLLSYYLPTPKPKTAPTGIVFAPGNVRDARWHMEQYLRKLTRLKIGVYERREWLDNLHFCDSDAEESWWIRQRDTLHHEHRRYFDGLRRAGPRTKPSLIRKTA